jgi:hypothetical protein
MGLFDFLKRRQEDVGQEEVTEFGPINVESPDEAMDLLIHHAVPAAPFVSDRYVLNQYKRDLVRVWDSKMLIKASMSQIESIVEFNVRIYFSQPWFKGCLVVSYPEHRCAQVIVRAQWSGVPIRVWKTRKDTYACGNSTFVLPSHLSSNVKVIA